MVLDNRASLVGRETLYGVSFHFIVRLGNRPEISVSTLHFIKFARTREAGDDDTCAFHDLVEYNLNAHSYVKF